MINYFFFLANPYYKQFLVRLNKIILVIFLVSTVTLTKSVAHGIYQNSELLEHFNDFLFVTDENQAIPYWATPIILQVYAPDVPNDIHKKITETIYNISQNAKASGTDFDSLSEISSQEAFTKEISGDANFLIIISNDDTTFEDIVNGNPVMSREMGFSENIVIQKSFLLDSGLPPTKSWDNCNIYVQINDARKIVSSVMIIDHTASDADIFLCLNKSRFMSFGITGEVTEYDFKEKGFTVIDEYELLYRLWAINICRNKFQDRSPSCAVQLLKLVLENKFDLSS